jgi:hypothetical protein
MCSRNEYIEELKSIVRRFNYGNLKIRGTHFKFIFVSVMGVKLMNKEIIKLSLQSELRFGIIINGILRFGKSLSLTFELGS